MRRLVNIVMMVMVLTIFVQAQEYIIGTEFYEIPDMVRPTKGETYTDPVFNINITRVTDRVGDGLPEIYYGSSTYTRGILIPEYARSDCENADDTKLIITQGEYSLLLYDANTYEFIKGLSEQFGGPIPENVEGSLEPRWDAEDPDVFYYVNRMGFYKYDISSDEITLIRDFSADFPDGWRLINDAEGEPSWDTRHWGFSVQRTSDWAKYAVITYDIETDQIIGTLLEDEFPDCSPYSEHCGHNTITISPLGDRVVVEWSWPSATISYAIDFSDPVLLGDDGHSDIGIDAEGNQVHVIKDDSYDVFAILDLKTGERTNLIDLPLTGSWDTASGYHVSANNYERPGWAVISTYGGDENTWPYYQVFLLELKENPRIYRIAHTHGQYTTTDDRYWSETKATINRAGTRIYWDSNWGEPSGDVDTYQAVLPETWWEDLSGPLQDCEALNGICCSSGETCDGSLKLSADCSVCCIGTCQSDVVCVHEAEVRPCDGCVDASELLAYVNEWKSGPVDITDLMEAIRIWKNG